jgi:hypothetical protein
MLKSKIIFNSVKFMVTRKSNFVLPFLFFVVYGSVIWDGKIQIPDNIRIRAEHPDPLTLVVNENNPDPDVSAFI